MARLISKTDSGIKEVVELSVEGGLYCSPNGLIHHNCDECKKLHLMPDGKIPRLWYLSELSSDYHHRNDPVPSTLGLHPHCRCVMFTLYPSWGFTKTGKIHFIKVGHDEISTQRA